MVEVISDGISPYAFAVLSAALPLPSIASADVCQSDTPFSATF